MEQSEDNKPEIVKALEAQIAELNGTLSALQAKQTELATKEQAATQAAQQAVLDLVPENMRALIPAGDVMTQLLWVSKAKQSGLLKPVVPTTDTSKPTVTPKDVDLSTLSPFARMSAAYSKK